MAAMDVWIVGGALLAIPLAYEARYKPDYGRAGVRWVMLAFAVLLAIAEAKTVRGFLYVLLMPIGAYKVVSVLTEPWLAPIGAARRDRARPRRDRADF